MLWLPVSMTIAAAAALINVWLMIRCGQARTRQKVSVGDGGDEFVIRRMRAHANFVETAPFVLILIILLEAAGVAQIWLWVPGIAWIFARILHPIGMDMTQKPWPRGAGVAATMLVLLYLIVFAGWTSFTAERSVPSAASISERV